MPGLITEIQRFSLNDGPGIRTTVFFKGCNMKCAWCHNPETISGTKDVHYYEKNCIKCYKCVSVCPSKAHKRIGGEHRYFPNLCIKCGKCTDICYSQAMVMSGREMTVEDIMDEVLQDKAYYLNSKGGVTLSGGEVLCQTEFAIELSEACHNNEIQVAIETNLHQDFETLSRLLENVDLVMMDIKIYDNEAHKKWVGVTNNLIFENLKKISKMNIPIIVRTPLIPGVTDSEDNIRNIAMFLKDIDTIQYYELLNFNPLGDSKYKSLSKTNLFEKTRPLSNKRIEELKSIAKEAGIEVRVE